MPVQRGESRGRWQTPKPPRSQKPKRTPKPTRDKGFLSAPNLSRPPATVPSSPHPNVTVTVRSSSLPGDPDVARKQKALRAAGYNIAVDGIWGAQTEAAAQHYNAGVAQRNRTRQRAVANIVKTASEPTPYLGTIRYRKPKPVPISSPSVVPITSDYSVRHRRLTPYFPGQRPTGWQGIFVEPNGQPSKGRPSKSARIHQVPYFENVAGPRADEGAQLSPAQLAEVEKIKRQTWGVPGTILRGGASLLGSTIAELGGGPSLVRAYGAFGKGQLARGGFETAMAFPFVRPIKGLEAANAAIKAADTGAGIAETVRAARAAYSGPAVVRAATRVAAKDKSMVGVVKRALVGSEERDLVHAEIDRQLSHDPKGAARAKQEMDIASAYQARANALKSGGKVTDHANDLYSRLYHQGRRNPFTFDDPLIVKNQTRRLRVNQLKELGRANRRMVDANGIPHIGRTSVDDVLRRMLIATPTAHQRAVDAAFYSDVRTVLHRVLDDKEIMAWLASQRAAAPSRGLTDLTRVLDHIRTGREIPPKGPGSIGVAAKTMEQLARGNTNLSSGARAKISDFVDAALHKTTRNWMGHDPMFGGPAVVDRWGYRSWGFADGDWLKKAPNGRKIGPATLKGDKINDDTYEFIARRYQELADRMNSMNNGKGLDGRNDWSVYEAQAMDWAAIQRYHGVHPEGMRYAFDINARTLQTGSPADALVAGLERHGIRLVDQPVADANGITSVRVLGSPESYQNLAQELADTHGQVWIMRDAGTGANKPMLTVTHPTADHVEAAEALGFTHYRELPDGTVELLAPKGRVNAKKLDELVKRMEAHGANVESTKVELTVVNGRKGTPGSNIDLSASAPDRRVDREAESGGAGGGAGPAAATGPAEAVGRTPGPGEGAGFDEFGNPIPGVRFASDAQEPLLYHGSPEGELRNIDTFHHTQPWREGVGFYLTSDPNKAVRYAAGRTARAARRRGPGRVNAMRLKPGAKVLDMDAQPRSFWEDLASKITGEKTDPAIYDQWARDISPKELPGASQGVLERNRLLHYIAGYHEGQIGEEDAYYAIEDAIAHEGYQATKHMEGKTPVWVVKDPDAVERHPGPSAPRPERGGAPPLHHYDKPRAEGAAVDEFGNPTGVRFASDAPDIDPAAIQRRIDSLQREVDLGFEHPAVLKKLERQIEQLKAIQAEVHRYDVNPSGELSAATPAETPGEQLSFDDQSLANTYENVDPIQWAHPDDFSEETLATPHEEVQDPYQELSQGMKGQRSQWGKQEKARHEERVKRAEEIRSAYESISDPFEARQAAAEAMRGELPRIDYKGLTTLNADSLKILLQDVKDHPNLLQWQKINLHDALVAAVQQGKMPTPYETRLMEHVFGKFTATGILQTAHGRWTTVLWNTLNIPRALQSTLDLSAVLRQGLVATAAHPRIASKAFKDMLKATASPQAYERLMTDIESDQLYPLALAARISFTDLSEHASLAAREEAFSSDYAAKIPILGIGVRASSRAYTGYLNKMRMDLFKHQIRLALAAGRDVNDEKFLRDIGKVINASTGRGEIGALEDWQPALNALFFSPRLMMSRINYLNPYWYVKLDGQARVEALRGFFAATGAVVSALALAERFIPGATVDWKHPRSANFGKIRVGDTRIDIAGGFQQYVHLASVLAPIYGGPAYISSTTGKRTKLGSGYGVKTGLDVLQDFFVGKAAPLPAAGMNVLRGTDQVGEPLTAKGFAEKTFIPLIVQDTKDIYNEHHGGINGIEWAIGGYGLGTFGLGIQTYHAKPPAGGGSLGQGMDNDMSGDIGGDIGGDISGGGLP